MTRQESLVVFSKEWGVATLAISLTILVLVSLTTLYTSRTVLLEQKMSSNDVRAKQAFDTAEAGVAVAIEYLSKDPDRDANGLVDNVFDTNNDSIGDSATAIVSPNNRVTVTATDLSGGAMTIIRVASQGFSDDFTATRTVTRTLSALDPLPNVPDNPLTTRGTVVVTGSATVINPEGHSTIWSGGNVDLGSNNSTHTEIADAADAGYPSCMDTSMSCGTVSTSNKVTVGLDVIEHDSSIANLSADEFFRNFFGMSPRAYRETMVTLDTAAAGADAAVQLASKEVIWVEGDAEFDSNTTVGCRSVVTGNQVCPAAVQAPSILIVNGSATFDGTPHFYGVVFVMGAINAGGNMTIYGALLAGDAINNQTGGSLDVTYHSDVLKATRGNGPLGSSSGSWRDF